MKVIRPKEWPLPPAPPRTLLADAERVYPGDTYMQMQWCKAIEFLRTTKRGWILDPKWKPTRLT